MALRVTTTLQLTWYALSNCAHCAPLHLMPERECVVWVPSAQELSEMRVLGVSSATLIDLTHAQADPSQTFIGLACSTFVSSLRRYLFLAYPAYCVRYVLLSRGLF